MKKWVLYFFLFIHLSTATQLSQLYKLPVFISHFIEHNEGGNFFKEMKTFLVHHYGGHEVDDDWETDQQLPFMRVDLIHIDFFIPTYPNFNLNLRASDMSWDTINSSDENLWHSKDLDSIWQPPKQA